MSVTAPVLDDVKSLRLAALTDEPEPQPYGVEPLLTVKDVRRVLPLSVAKIYALIDAGALRAIRLPGCARVLVAPADLRAYIDAGRTASPTDH